MKVTGQFEKWGVGVLGAVSLVLIARLVFQFSHGPLAVARPGASAPPHAKARRLTDAKGATGKQTVSDELSRYNPLVNLELLKEFEERPLPELARDPFQFVSAPKHGLPVQTTTAAAPPPPPSPPPVTLKPMGLTEEGGVKEAMVSDEDQVYVVHEGDSVGTRYKVIKITPTVITVEDSTLHQTVDLPVPQ